MTGIIRKLFTCVLIVVVLIQPGCASLSGSNGKDKENPREELVLWAYYETKMQKLSMDGLVEGFNSSQEKYYLTWEYHGPVTEFNKKLAIGITQNQLPDMVILDNPDMLSYIHMDKLEDLTDVVPGLEGFNEYFPEAIKSVEYEGRYYGLPFCCNNIVLFYNKDMFAEKGISVPKTLEEFKKTAGILSNPDRYGFAMSAINGHQGVFQFGTFMLSSYEDLEKACNKGIPKSFKFIQDLVDKGFMSPDCVNWSQNDVAKIFTEGKCAMMENGPWVFPMLDESDINYGITTFPASGISRGFLGGEDIAVIKGKNIEGCKKFLQYYSQADTMLNINLCANSLPPRKDVARHFLKVKPQYSLILQQMDKCISRGSIDKWTELSEQLSDGLYDIITTDNTPEQVYKKIRK